MMPKAKQGDTVKIHYTGRLKDGTVFDTSQDRDPLEFKLGEGQVIPGFENAVEGMEPGDSKTANIPPTEAYGPRRDDLVLEVPRTQLPEDLNPEVGQQLQMRTQEGGNFPVTVTDATDEVVKVDANHPLAGRDLEFDIQLVGIN